MTLNIKPEPVFAYQNGKWQSLSSDPSTFLPLSQISLGCYNVLFPSTNFFKKLITSDDERYKYQIEQLFPQLDIDILALSEVTETYINFLLEKPWIQQTYYVFNPKKIAFQSFFGNLILSKFPMKCYSMDNLIYGRISIGLINQPNNSFLILSVHLVAFERNHHIRRKQFNKILEGLCSYSNKDDPYFDHFKAAVANKNIIILGDLNFHLKLENKLVWDHGFIDLWTETNEADGYSWDTLKNPLINVCLPFDNRRMRLDRIMFLEGSRLFAIRPDEKMEIFGNKKVFPNKKISYLMGSDHFGLCVKIETIENLEIYKRKVVNKEDFDKMTKNDGFRSEKTIIIYRVLTVLFLIIIILCIFSIII